jgi:hypothetical protein
MNYYDEYNEYLKYEDIIKQKNNKSKQKNNKSKGNKVSCYSSKHIRIQQSKKLKN